MRLAARTSRRRMTFTNAQLALHRIQTELDIILDSRPGLPAYRALLKEQFRRLLNEVESIHESIPEPQAEQPRRLNHEAGAWPWTKGGLL